VNADLARLLVKHGGVLHRSDVLARVPHHVLDRAVAGGHLVRVLPQIYIGAQDVNDLGLARAVVRYADGHGVLSHSTALWLWGLLETPGRPIHLTIGPRARPRGLPVLRVHRDYGDPPVGRSPRWREGLPTTTLERALLQSWPILEAERARAVLIRAVRERRSTTDRLADELARLPRVAGRSNLAALIGLLSAGCQSELELFGLRDVFTGPGFAQLRPQHRVRMRGRTVYLDLAAEDLRVGVELDGAAYHDGTAVREGDRRRDVLLAAEGWVVLRFGYRRLVDDPDGVRRDVLAVLDVRRRQLRSG
jgi:very-short-patch-repair endonuclease